MLYALQKELQTVKLLFFSLLLLLLSHFSRVRLCVTLQTAAYQAPPSLGFSRQEHWSGLPFPSPRHESEKWKWSRSVVSNPQRPHGLQPSRLLHPWDFPGRGTGVGCHCQPSTSLLYSFSLQSNTLHLAYPATCTRRAMLSFSFQYKKIKPRTEVWLIKPCWQVFQL